MNTTRKSSPVQIGALTTWAEIGTMAQGGVVVVKTDGTLWSWGSNYRGQGGRSTGGGGSNTSSPIQVGALTDWYSVSGNSSECNNVAAIKTDGTLWMWGRNARGGCGINTSVETSSPVQVGSETDWSWTATSQGGASFGVRS